MKQTCVVITTSWSKKKRGRWFICLSFVVLNRTPPSRHPCNQNWSNSHNNNHSDYNAITARIFHIYKMQSASVHNTFYLIGVLIHMQTILFFMGTMLINAEKPRKDIFEGMFA